MFNIVFVLYKSEKIILLPSKDVLIYLDLPKGQIFGKQLERNSLSRSVGKSHINGSTGLPTMYSSVEFQLAFVTNQVMQIFYYALIKAIQSEHEISAFALRFAVLEQVG